MLRVGIDLGGTKIAVGLIDESGRILARGSVPTKKDRPYVQIIADMAKCVQDTVMAGGYAVSDVSGVGIGIPGLPDMRTGKVIYCVNLHWQDVPLAQEMEQLLQKPITIGNDATVAGLAEYAAGASRGSTSSVFLTLGTGVGSGIIINGQAWVGCHGVGGEVGHTMLRMGGEICNCGDRGCVDRYCSASAVIREGRLALRRNNSSIMVKMCGGDPEILTAKHVFDAAREGDVAAMEVFSNYVTDLAQTIDSIISFLDPEIIVLGGGISKAGSFLLDAVRNRVPQMLLYRDMPFAKIMLAELGEDAGIIGAAMLA